MNKQIRVFKFGGASVKDAAAVKNLYTIVKEKGDRSHLVIAVSAMGKMTNAFELLHRTAHAQENFNQELQRIKKFHFDVVTDLFDDAAQVRTKLDEHFSLLESTLTLCHRMAFDFTYDQVVSFGELLSTTIISEFLTSKNVHNQWIDARRCILTDSTWRNATVNYEWSSIFCKKNILPEVENSIVVTQGFIGSDADGNTTTLGREGSDFSAAILAYLLDAESVTIWKDVDGILSADPKRIPSATKYDQLSYEEVIEMSYYGATVIHPKTLKPLANKSIPLYVRSFLKPEKPGTKIGIVQHERTAPAVIIKDNQTLISFRKKDLSFMEEKHLVQLMNYLSDLDFKINLVQKSALNFSTVTDFDEKKIQALHDKVKEVFFMHYNDSLTLITIKNYETLEIPEEIECSEVLLEQKTRKNIQYLVK